MLKQKLRRVMDWLTLSALVLMTSAVFSVCLAATHYVDNAAAGANNGTTWTNAWRSLANINWAAVAAGDIIYISGGASGKVYRENLIVGKSGSAGNHITITKGKDVGHNGQVIIDGQKSRAILVNLLRRSHVTVSNLTLRNPKVSDGGRAINIKSSNNVRVDHNTVTSSTRAGIFIENSSNSTISRNSVSTESYVSQQTDAIYSQRNKNVIFDGNRLVINNGEKSGHNDCLQSYLDSDLIVRNNYCEQNNIKTVNAQGIYLSTSYGTMQVYNNVVNAPNTYNSLIAIRLPNHGVHGIIVNNMIIGGKYGSLKVEGDPAAVIKNNIIYKYNGGIALAYSGSMKYVKNNIQNDLDLKQDANSMLFTGFSAIDKGAVPAAPCHTGQKKVVQPMGSGFDIGAYEKNVGFMAKNPQGEGVAPMDEKPATRSTTERKRSQSEIGCLEGAID